MPGTSLANIKQGEGGSLESYIHRFNMEAAKVGSLTKGELKTEITAGVHPNSKIWDNMLKREVNGLDDFYESAQKYIHVKNGHENLKAGKSESHVKPSAYEGSNGAKKKMAYKGPRDYHQRKPKRRGDPRQMSYTFYTIMSDTREHIYLMNEGQIPFMRPPPMRKYRSQRDPSKYCHYRKDIGHTTTERIHLKVQIEELIRKGHLGRYVRRENQRLEEASASPRARERALEVQGEVRMIFRGP
ncbi:uncharacterized protein LOC133779710 [Humulus lupulus]|uniref:uncharacterized protein LOC133779710 n=1 Tax=Humulus lupulus TaxID=3486 RepID=UPI002B405981|nr:uncharacterized protein LOC133779710 [Humulus lupulus]